MSVIRASKVSEHPLADAAQALSEIARELGHISRTLATGVEDESPEAKVLGKTEETLASLSRELDKWRVEETGGVARLRQQILSNLLRRGPALPIELAAVTLSLPEEVQPVLEAMEREGLIAIEEMEGGRLVTITARGRAEARR